MAYSFNGGTDRILFPASTRADGLAAWSFSAWVIRNGNGGGGFGRLFSKNELRVLNINAGGVGNVNLGVTVAAASVASDRFSSVNSLPNAAATWVHIGVSWSGTITNQTSFRIYINGAETSYLSGTNGAGAVTSDAGAQICIGNRQSDSARGWDGSICEAALWGSVLTPSEFLSLARNFRPPRVSPSTLRHYSPMVRSAPDMVEGGVATITGTSFVSHPRMYG